MGIWVADGFFFMGICHGMTNNSMGTFTDSREIPSGEPFIVDFPIKNGDFPLLC